MKKHIHFLGIFMVTLCISFLFSCATGEVSNDTDTPTEEVTTSTEIISSGTEPLRVPDVKGKSYDEARKMIIADGWKPVAQEDEVAMAPGGVATSGNGKIFWERGYVEVDACAGTGLGQCAFTFFDGGGMNLFVVTVGEQKEDNSENATVSEAYVEAAKK